MRALSNFLSCSNKILSILFHKVLPEFIRLIILAVCVLWSYYNLVRTNYKYASTINEKSRKFCYRKRGTVELSDCSICLSEFAEGEEGREVVECKHAFHRRCLEKWLRGGYTATATCPLCRSLVVPEVVVAEHRRMKMQLENYGVEKELALILFNALHVRGSCSYGFF
ncbi:E3 ubiquitin-protein ligase RHA2A [Sesamum alatum]|uniref:E3 ubiquitin-protein ligase RHA2A n=1 Tax=Sesamum alatum TaxID=300844 RepID=A0AAE1YE82_9LAMI|nr:E3 ubiquitin-protein ligase RHA2A [Sesamum alatum]